jgi:hypothetical protein
MEVRANAKSSWIPESDSVQDNWGAGADGGYHRVDACFDHDESAK